MVPPTYVLNTGYDKPGRLEQISGIKLGELVSHPREFTLHSSAEWHSELVEGGRAMCCGYTMFLLNDLFPPFENLIRCSTHTREEEREGGRGREGLGIVRSRELCLATGATFVPLKTCGGEA